MFRPWGSPKQDFATVLQRLRRGILYIFFILGFSVKGYSSHLLINNTSFIIFMYWEYFEQIHIGYNIRPGGRFQAKLCKY